MMRRIKIQIQKQGWSNPGEISGLGFQASNQAHQRVENESKSSGPHSGWPRKRKGALQLGSLTAFQAPVSGRCHSSFIARAQPVVTGLHTELLSVGLRLLTCLLHLPGKCLKNRTWLDLLMGLSHLFILTSTHSVHVKCLQRAVNKCREQTTIKT